VEQAEPLEPDGPPTLRVELYVVPAEGVRV
jgi:hypothetical protein